MSAELSPEQLLEYIKKQKSRIKRLEQQCESLQKGKESTSDGSTVSEQTIQNNTLFWEMINRAPPFQQKLGRAALNSLVLTLGLSSIGKIFPSQLKRASFGKWKTFSLKIGTVTAEKIAEDAKQNLSQLEQRVGKLKGLLAKTYHANQRISEDTNAYKRAQEEATGQIKALKQKDEIERQTMLETMRVQSIESAFAYDMELVIQRAAEEMINQQSQVVLTQSSGVSRKVKDIEEEKARLNEKVADLEVEIKRLHVELQGIQLEVDSKRIHSEELNLKNSELKEIVSDTEKKLAEEKLLRADLEIELSATLSNRADVIRNVEQAAELKANRKVAEAIEEVADLRRQLEIAERAARVAVADFEKAEEELVELRSVQIESRQLASAVAELTQANEQLLAEQSSRLAEQQQPPPLAPVDPVESAAAEPDPTPLVVIPEPALPLPPKESFLTPSHSLLLKQVLRIVRTDSRRSSHLAELLTSLSLAQRSNIKTLYDNILQVADEISLFPQKALESAWGFLKDYFGGNEVAGALTALSAQIDDLRSRLHALQSDSSLSSPMTWEASSVVIPTGRDISIPIPVNTHASTEEDGTDTATLEWLVLSESSNAVEFYLSHPKHQPLMLVSVQSYSEGSSYEQRGSHEIPLAESDPECYLLRLCNASMWGAITVSYKIRLAVNNGTDLQQEEAELLAALEVLESRRQRLSTVYEQGQSVYEEVEFFQRRTTSRRLEHIDGILAVAGQYGSGDQLATTVGPSYLTALDHNRAYTESLCDELWALAESVTEEAAEPSAPGDAMLLAAAVDEEPPLYAGLAAGEAVSVSLEDESTSAASLSPAEAPQSSSAPAPSAPPAVAEWASRVYSSESFYLKAAEDFRLPIPVLREGDADSVGPIRLEWEFSILSKNGTTSSATVGFAVLKQLPDGTLPQIVPYRRIEAAGDRGSLLIDDSNVQQLVFLFDNSFSWLRPKTLKYRVSIAQPQSPSAVETVETALSPPLEIQADVDQDISPDVIDEEEGATSLLESQQADLAAATAEDDPAIETAEEEERFIDSIQDTINSRVETVHHDGPGDTEVAVIEKLILYLMENGEFLCSAVKDFPPSVPNSEP